MVRLDEGGAAAADVRLFAPPPSLRPWVQHVSIQPGPARHARWRVVPDTSAHVSFRRGGRVLLPLVLVTTLAQPSPVREIAHLQFRSSFWVNLHHTLYAAARPPDRLMPSTPRGDL